MSVEKIGNINGVQQNFRTPKQNTDLDPFDLDLQIKESPPGPNDGAGYTTGTKTFCGTCTCMTCYSICTCNTCATCVDCK